MVKARSTAVVENPHHREDGAQPVKWVLCLPATLGRGSVG